MLMEEYQARHIRMAREADLLPDQLARFYAAGYVPQHRQLDFHVAAAECDYDDGPTAIGYGGTRGQAKSHAVFAQAVLDDMQAYDGLKWLYLRLLGKRARESIDDLRLKVLKHTQYEYKNSKLILPNGSFMILGGYRSENDVDSYLGLEYDGIVIEDATVLSATKYTVVGTVLRTSREDWRPRMYLSANPGGIGHQWFKKMFYDPWKRGKQTDTRFVHTTMGDNAFLNKEYAQRLDNLQGWLRRAWRDGDFEISAGQFFDNWDYDRIVVETQPVPHGWTYWLSMDYGYIHPTVVYLLGQAPGDDVIDVIDEHIESRWQVSQHVDGINTMLTRNGISYSWLRNFVVGGDVFGNRDDAGVSIADKFAKLGMVLQTANMDRINGAAEVLHRMGSDRLRPTLRIYSRCRGLAECLPRMLHDPVRPERVLKVNADDETGEGGDDCYDALRYGVMGTGRGSLMTRVRIP